MACALVWKAVVCLKMISKAKRLHGRGEHLCLLCDTATAFQEDSVLDHILARHHNELHLNCELDLEEMMDNSKLIVLTCI